MATKRRSSFDPKVFLAKIGDGHAVSKYRKDQIIFSQGDPADAVFYVQRGKVKLTVISEQGREAVMQPFWDERIFRRRMPRWTDAAYRNSRGHDALCNYTAGEGCHHSGYSSGTDTR